MQDVEQVAGRAGEPVEAPHAWPDGQLDASLRRLGTDRLELYLLHWPNGITDYAGIVEGAPRWDDSSAPTHRESNHAGRGCHRHERYSVGEVRCVKSYDRLLS